MISNQQISDYIYYYPQVLGPTACDNLIAHYNKDTFMRWKTSTFSTTSAVTGTSKVDMKEFWIGPNMFGYQTIKQGFETDVLQPHNSFVYVVEMLFNGFEFERINSSAFPNQNFEGKQIRFIFEDDVDEVDFGKEYQIEVKKENESLGYLNIIVTDIVKR